MKKIILFFCTVAVINNSFAQFNVDSLRHALDITQNDTEKLVVLTDLSTHYLTSQNDSTIYYAKKEAELAHKLHFEIDEAYTFDVIGFSKFFADDPNTLESLFEGLAIIQDPKIESVTLPAKYLNRMMYGDGYVNLNGGERRTPHNMRLEIMANLNFDVGNVYGFKIENVDKQWSYYLKAKNIYETIKDTLQLGLIYGMIGFTHYTFTNQFDSAIVYAQKGNELLMQTGQNRWIGQGTVNLAHIYYEKGDYSSARKYYDLTYNLYEKGKFPDVPVYLDVLNFYLLQRASPDSNLRYAQEIFDNTKKAKSNFFLPEASTMLAKAYKAMNKKDSAYKYFEYSLTLLDSANNIKSIKQFQNQDNMEQKREQEAEAIRIELKNQVKFYALIAGLGVMFLVAVILLRNNRERKKSNSLLQKQKEEIENTLVKLKLTQAQLIQSEKMASLGELTAGIAHEIQNPLNFVNNFSDVNRELLEELKEEADKGNIDEVKAIANDVIENQGKINHHGKRADAIVKGMLQHSRVSSGQTELTDLNALAGEYLRLSYNGIRAKDKSFNATLQTDFDESIGKINIVPQDIGKVLLNLYNNAFYAVQQKEVTPFQKVSPLYKPLITASTKKINDKVEIKITDNGNGIPQNIIDKIFQPFFTTKPTGQGTGLGLSLSYDIIKAYGGTIIAESKENEFTEFTITLPINLDI